eukprot:TRINITY_DN1099_c0_g1_i2.p1 TRINITY_DN1099_c0_g1~~TRINITY_DN1099_c0_g1_i2.p1  ORF type:complete len:816 (-),score=173.64 TRINITY_DN1099_c0_g1_i2:14-2461(-)
MKNLEGFFFFNFNFLVNLFLKPLGFLKRSLSQQSSVREILYTGLHDIFRDNKSLREPILELLVPQFLKYFTEDENQVPLHLEQCVDNKSANIKVEEPLPHLLQTLQRCVILESKRSTPSELAQKASDTLQSLTSRLIKTNLSDFDLDKSSDFTTSREGLTNRETSLLLLGTYQVLFEFAVMREKSMETFETALSLFESFTKLENLRETALSTKTKKVEKDASTTDPPKPPTASTTLSHTKGRRPGSSSLTEAPKSELLYSMNCVLIMLDLLLPTSTGQAHGGPSSQSDKRSLTNEKEQVRAMLLGQSELQQAFFATALKLLHSFTSPDSPDPETSLLKYSTHLFPLLLNHFLLHWNSPKSNKGKPLGLLALECMECVVKYVANKETVEKLAQIMEVSFNRINNNYPDTAACLSDDAHEHLLSRSNPPETQIHGYIFKFEKMLRLLKIEDDTTYSKEGETIFMIIDHLLGFVPTQLITEHVTWVEQFMSIEVEVLPLAKSIVNLYLKICRSSIDLSNLMMLAKEIYSKIGAVSEEPASLDDRKFLILNNTTDKYIILATLSCIDSCLDDVETATNLLPSKKSLEANKGEQDNTKILKLKENICDRLQNIVETLLIIVSSCIVGNQFEQLVRLTTKLYKFMSTLTKNITESPPSPFRRLIEKIGTNLTPGIYQLLEYSTLNDDNKSKAKLRRETTLKPNLIYQIERYESILIKICKRYNLDLAKTLRRSQARDFRIIKSDLMRVSNHLDGSDDEAKKKTAKKQKKDETEKSKKVRAPNEKKGSKEKPKAKARGRPKKDLTDQEKNDTPKRPKKKPKS